MANANSANPYSSWTALSRSPPPQNSVDLPNPETTKTESRLSAISASSAGMVGARGANEDTLSGTEDASSKVSSPVPDSGHYMVTVRSSSPHLRETHTVTGQAGRWGGVVDLTDCTWGAPNDTRAPAVPPVIPQSAAGPTTPGAEGAGIHLPLVKIPIYPDTDQAVRFPSATHEDTSPYVPLQASTTPESTCISYVPRLI